MKLSQLTYHLPKQLIAHTPIEPRDHSKLMVINRKTKALTHQHFFDLPNILTPDDVLVFNQTKVFPAKLTGYKKSGGVLEALLLEEVKPLTWKAIIKGKVSTEQTVVLGKSKAVILNKQENEVLLQFNKQPLGEVPLPPYINSTLPQDQLTKRYQTVYAKEEGSVAAPTAGFHFTNTLLNTLSEKDIQMEYVTLHVGLGTFLPIKTDDLGEHKMHAERFFIDEQTASRLTHAKQSGKRIISVGTTSTRVLETWAANLALSGTTDIFIYPPFKFKFVDALITNFHLPHSTLLALISAFVTAPNTPEQFTDFESCLMGKAYQEAIKNDYRFYSFGDASIIV